jgi:dihydrofolate reductase
LPGRRNIVISRTADYSPTGGELAPSLQAAITMAAGADEIFVIGGADIYRQALPLAQRLYLTEIALDVAGDAHFPEFSPADWSEVSRETHTSASGIAYAFVLYQHL